MAKRRSSESVSITEAVGYIRVSTQSQAESGLGLEVQRSRMKAFCEAKGWRLIAVHEDAGFSAKNLKRPALHAALAQLRPGRILLAYKLDRLTRNARELYDLTDRISDAGSAWATIEGDFDTSSAIGHFIVRIIAEIAELERRMISERTIAALKAKAARRGRLGTTPLGYFTEQTPDGPRIRSVSEEQETVRMARALRQRGLSLRQISAELTKAGRKTKRGGKWAAETVKLLLSERYMERNPSG